MPISNILTFFGFFIAIALVLIFVFVIFHNEYSKIAINKFIVQVNVLNPIVIKNVKLRYWITNGFRTIISPCNSCDLFLFENCLCIVRRQNFIIKVLFAPVLIASDFGVNRTIFNFIDMYKPDSITFKTIIKGEIDIRLKDPSYKYRRIDITLKQLTNEQVYQLEKIKEWC